MKPDYCFSCGPCLVQLVFLVISTEHFDEGTLRARGTCVDLSAELLMHVDVFQG